MLDSRKTETGSGKGPSQIDVLKTARESAHTLVDVGPIHRIVGDALQIPCGMILGSDDVQPDGTMRLEPATYF
jgi:hypothetical protein